MAQYEMMKLSPWGGGQQGKPTQAGGGQGETLKEGDHSVCLNPHLPLSSKLSPTEQQVRRGGEHCFALSSASSGLMMCMFPSSPIATIDDPRSRQMQPPFLQLPPPRVRGGGKLAFSSMSIPQWPFTMIYRSV